MKTTIFIDGTWLYYSLYTAQSYLSDGWHRTHDLDYDLLPSLITAAVESEAGRRLDVTSTLVFTSQSPNTPKQSPRHKMLSELAASRQFKLHEVRRG